MKTKSKVPVLALIVCVLLCSCGLPKEALTTIGNDVKVMVDYPVDYYNLFPTPSFEQWDKDYNSYEQLLTPDVKRTQMGLSFVNNGVHIWWCAPSARTHVQLDTVTRIIDPKRIIGEWRIECNRKITYEDSASYIEKKIYRNHEVIIDDKEDDLYLSISGSRFNLYLKKKGETSFKSITRRNYEIQNQRYLMLYGMSRAGAAISFIGLTKEGKLIINAYYVQERKVKGKYIVYQATMTQFIFRRIA